MTTKLGVRWGVKPPLLSGQPKEILRANRVIEQKEDLMRGLVAYYNDDGKSAATWQDMVNYPNGKNNGTVYGAGTPPPATPGALGYLFDGIDDYVDAGNGASLRNNDSFTASFWMKRQSATTGVVKIISYLSGRSYNDIYLYTGENIYFSLFDGVNNPSVMGSVIPLNEWSFITVVRNTPTSQMLIYINSIYIDQASDTTVGSSIIGTSNLYIGSTLFNGSIDEVRIYNRALSAGEIIKLFNANRGKFGI